MASYRFLFRDIVTGTVQGELPLEKCTYGEVLNKPGSFSATMALRPETDVATITSQTLAPGRTALYVERDGAIVGGFILWTLDGDVDANQLTLGGEGLMSYFGRRIFMTDVAAIGGGGFEQVSIASFFIDYAQAQPDSAQIINAYAMPSTGVLRERSYSPLEAKNILEAIEQLAAVENGFDFRVQIAPDLTATFVTQYPAIGRSTDLVLDMEANVSLLSFTVDATTVINGVVVTSSQSDGTAGFATEAVSGTGYPLLQGVVALSEVSDTTTMYAHADRALKRGTETTLIPTVVVYNGNEPAVGSFLIGDIVRVRGTLGWLDVDDNYRVTEWSCDVDDSGGETLKLSLAPLELFQ